MFRDWKSLAEANRTNKQTFGIQCKAQVGQAARLVEHWPNMHETHGPISSTT